jgi:putrescine transport system substrate-binding protein
MLVLALAVAALAAFVAVRMAHQGRGERRLYIYNWADFIGRRNILDFEKATGIHVVYDTYDSEETKETKLMAGGSGYDLVVSSSEYYAREIKAGVYVPLDRHRLPGWSNLDPHALEISARADPDNSYALPYMHAVNGFAYNVDMVRQRMPDAPVDSLDMIFKPEVVKHFADCGVTFLDSPEDMLQLALNYLHLDPNSTRPEDYEAAGNLLTAVRPFVRSFDSSEYLNAMANGELCVAVSWSSDYAVSVARARAAGVTRHLAFTVPREGANRTYSSWLMPQGAQHVDEAYAFLNYLLRPEVIAAVTNDIYYGNDNRESRPFVRPEILADPTIYPPADMEARLYPSLEAGVELERLRTRTWTRVKTAH